MDEVAEVDRRRLIPRTDAVLADPRLVKARESLAPAMIAAAVSRAQQAARDGEITADQVVDRAVANLPMSPSSLRPVINATGVVVHTNLGRAPLSAQAREALLAAAGATNVELDLVSGTRATRGADALVALRQAVPDAGDVHVVNNGAAALVLAVTALARGRELVVSRGELVEIGDGFRIADLLESTGAHLREVGATNRTTLADYASGIGPQTGCVLKVHPSNFRITGFASDVAVRDLSTLTAPRHIPLVVDIGSGLLAPDAVLPEEPDAASTLRAGASLVIASGDKLLGGPQAGLLLGDAGLIHDLRRDPLARALRVDKLTLAALEATLLGPETPVAQALHADPAMLHSRAQAIAQATGTEVLPSDGAVGGGGAPGVVLPGWAVALPCELADVLRKGDPPVVGRVSKGRLLLDVRCVPPEMDGYLCTAIRDAFR